MSEYDNDILSWSEHQAALLRRLAAGEQVNAEIDWDHVVEEVESVGRNDLRACRSLLLQAFLHDLKAEAWPLSPSVPHWRSEARIARINAADAYAPSMRQRIDLARLYQQALGALPSTMDGQEPGPVPTVCPLTLEELLDHRTDTVPRSQHSSGTHQPKPRS